MPEHKHDERRIAWERVTLQEVVGELWPIIVEQDAERAAGDVETDREI
jgi:hypothetical protein